jgi:hypothetical protein
MRPVLPLTLAAAFVAFGAAAGCGAEVRGGVYRDGAVAFRVGPVPEGWQRIPVSHAALAYRDEAEGSTVLVNARCGLDGEDVPLEALTQHLFLRFTEREILDQKVLPFDRREAMRTVIAAKLDGVPMKFEVWVLKKDGCVYDLGYMASPTRFDRGAPEFERFVQGFSTVPSHAD